ncbi:hypothetical protein [Aedoeadaptatus urinae]|uniref:hypothetical protein n=1 Tax=Aedoeadaptatus urinae TaxID=1871017 RepID=UPI00097D0B37|nr:hypothetical protein [Peptoniphilus urinae]
MNKKFLSLVLALVMVLGTFSSVFAAAPAKKEEAKKAPKATETVVPKKVGKAEKIKWLQDNNIVLGRKVNEDPKNNDLALDKNVRRAEVSKLLVYAIGLDKKADSLQGAYKLYSDVDLTHWANGYINVGSTEPSKANNLPFLIGYPGNVFKPAKDVTYAELAKMLVTLTKKDLTKDMHDQANKEWPVKWMAWAYDLGIFEDVTVADANKAVNREDAFTMIYNAMYKLNYIKKMPVNEVRGILSQIKNGEITINQGDKAKTLKFTPNTTFVLYQRNQSAYDVNVNPHHTNPAQIVFAGAVSNPQYYYGSFVRVLANDKGEVTHVLELGNPADLAIGSSNNDQDNARWADVADRTLETVLGRVIDFGGNRYGSVDSILAKINYNNGDPKSITFQGGRFMSPAKNVTDAQSVTNWVYQAAGRTNDWSRTLKLTSKTKYYVADVVKNQLTEVNSVDEALRILGNTAASNWFDNVYAGYNVTSPANKQETSRPAAIQGYNEATVVVFNRVQKDNNGTQMLRVTNEATRDYNLTFENTAGDKIVKNVGSYRFHLPFNFNDGKLNVVNYSVNAALGIKVDLLIKHKDTVKYPIVEVVKYDGNKLIVKDERGNTARLFTTGVDANIFCDGQLKAGKLIQFRTLAGNVVKDAEGRFIDSTRTNTVDIVSVMPDGIAKAGVLQNVVYNNQKNQGYAAGVKATDLTKYGLLNGYKKWILSDANNIYDEDAGVYVDYFVVNDTEAYGMTEAIKAGHADFRYKFKKFNAGDEKEAYDFEFYDEAAGVWKLVREVYPMPAALQPGDAV